MLFNSEIVQLVQIESSFFKSSTLFYLFISDAILALIVKFYSTKDIFSQGLTTECFPNVPDLFPNGYI